MDYTDSQRKIKIAHLIPEPDDNRSMMEKLAELKTKHPHLYEEAVNKLIDEKGEEWFKNIRYDWSVNARPKQLMPEPREGWRVWANIQGRGSGKTRTGSESVKQWVSEHPEGEPPLRIALVGATASDVNDTMISGDSGILSVYPEHDRPRWSPTSRKIIWQHSDGTTKAIASSFSAEEPERLRGPQFHKAWVDEIATFKYKEAWDNLMFGLRLGDNPQAIVTTTPKPIKMLLDILALPTTWTTKGSSYENRSNLAPAFFEEIITKYEGTRIGRQELEAEIIEEIPNALWTYELIEKYRVGTSTDSLTNLPNFLQIVLAIDPATTSTTRSAETGMCVAAYGDDDQFYILELTGVVMKPEDWVKKALNLYDQYGCDKIIAEVNNGGDLVESMIKVVNPLQKIYPVHASRGKMVRADPIATLYERGRVHHVGYFAEAEYQMTSFNPIENPTGLCDRVDALVWALSWLVAATQGRLTYKPAVGGVREKLVNYKDTFRY